MITNHKFMIHQRSLPDGNLFVGIGKYVGFMFSSTLASGDVEVLKILNDTANELLAITNRHLIRSYLSQDGSGGREHIPIAIVQTDLRQQIITEKA